MKNNIERFDEDFRFQLTKEEFDNLRSKKSTSSWGGNRYLPFAFTEQGIYMLMTVLRSELAINQSKMLIRLFKRMKDYITENKVLIDDVDIVKVAIQSNQNKQEIKQIKDDISKIMDNFIDESKIKEFVFVDGQKFEADEAYISIYKQARKSVYVVNGYNY